MRTARIDNDTVDRILSGSVDPVDAPPGYEAAVTLIAAARGASVPARSRVARPVRATPRFRPRLPIHAAALVLGGASGAAYAAGLPAAASSTAHDVLRSLESSAGAPPGPSGASHTGAAGMTAAPGTTAGTDSGTASAGGRDAGSHRHPSPASRKRHRRQRHHGHHGHGATISALAHSTTGTAGVKGATVSAAASNGKSHAGEHGHNGQSQTPHGHGHSHSHSQSHGHSSHHPR
jgi:hypothetical protein